MTDKGPKNINRDVRIHLTQNNTQWALHFSNGDFLKFTYPLLLITQISTSVSQAHVISHAEICLVHMHVHADVVTERHIQISNKMAIAKVSIFTLFLYRVHVNWANRPLF